MLVAVECEVTVVEIDHRDARAQEPRKREHRHAGAERESGVGVAQVVEVARRLDPRPVSGTPAQARDPAPEKGFEGQGRQDSNLQPPVLETGALPVELRPYGEGIVPA